MQRVFVGLLVGVCVIMFASPLMAVDLAAGINLSNLQSLNDAQLSQISGKSAPPSNLGVPRYEGPPPGFSNFTDGYPQGVYNAVKESNRKKVGSMSRALTTVN